MRNSTFFKEASIVATKAMQYKEPLTVGITRGIRHLKALREKHPVFKDETFARYVDYYAAAARFMVEQRLLFLEGHESPFTEATK